MFQAGPGSPVGYASGSSPVRAYQRVSLTTCTGLLRSCTAGLINLGIDVFKVALLARHSIHTSLKVKSH